jgi:3-hydroxyacyl-[acyl-carrier-protein] dehydratase
MAGGEHKDKLALFAGIDGVRFRRQVLPGDVLRMEVQIERLKGRVGRGRGRATVGDERVCEAELMFAFAERREVE